MSRLHRRTSALARISLVVAGLLCSVPAAQADKVLLGARAQAKSARVAPKPVRSPTSLRSPAQGRASSGARPSPAALRAARLGLGDLKAAGQLLAGRAEPHWVRAAGRGETLPGTLRFPVAKGYATRGFGSGKGGYHQAVDIGGEPGVKVRASAAGIVGYAGNGVSGYGNMVILVHAGGAITSYAHNHKNLVASGQKVNKGAVIGLLGSTGRSQGPHLHFELLFQGENCDPMPLFRPGATRKSGAPAASAASSWKHANKRPKSIRCFPRKHHPDYIARPQTFEDHDQGGSDPGQP